MLARRNSIPDTVLTTGKAANKAGRETSMVSKHTAKGTERVARKTGTPMKKGAEETGHNTGDAA